jgi:DNA primase
VTQAWVSFDLVKAQVSIVDVLRRYGFFDSLHEKGHQLVGHCPFHKDSKPSFKVTPARNIWHCFGACRCGGDVIDLVCAAEGIATGHRTSNRWQAALLLQDWFGIAADSPAIAAQDSVKTAAKETDNHRVKKEGREAVEHRVPTVINPPLGFTLKNLDHEGGYAYAASRGITRNTAAAFGLGVALAGRYKGRLVFPLFDHEGILVGYGSRALDESEPRYLFPSNDKGFYKSHIVFHLSAVTAQHERAVVVVEGLFDCMKVTQAGFPAVAILGCDLSARQAELLCTHFERIMLFLDGDEAGRAGADQALVEIGRRGRYVRAVVVPDGGQPDELSEDEIKALLTP